MGIMLKSIFSAINRNFVNVGITVVIILISHNFIISFFGRQALQERNDFEITHLKINERIELQTTMINLMDLGLRGYFMNRKENFLDPYNIANQQFRQNLDTFKQMLRQIDYAKIDDIDLVKAKVTEYFELVGQGIQYIKNDEPERAVDLFKNDPGYDLWKSNSPIIQNITDFINQRNNESKEKYEAIAFYSLISQFVTVLIGMPILIIVLIKLLRQEKRIVNLFQELEESNQKYIFRSTDKLVDYAKLNQALIINKIINNLKRATNFIQSITGGNLEAQWEGMDGDVQEMNKGTLAGELVEMRNQLQTVRKADKQRQWIAEGITNFSDVVRSHKDDFHVMTAKVISFVVTYVNANQGGLYLLNNTDPEDQFIELSSCFAYNKQKFIEKRIEIGYGLLGQAFLEGQTAVYKDIPEDYIAITSGLGEALPRNLILVPIKFDQNIQGVLEVASFTIFEKYQIEFLEKICEILASEIVTNKSAQLTQTLLTESRENQEMMRSQEEEMRQNMEELQATQEEQARQRAEMETRIKELEEALTRQ